jgi:hypothetical protein
MSDDEMDVESGGVKVRVQLNSLVPEYTVPKDAIAVPSEVRKSGLSKVVNYLLGNVEGNDDSSDSDSDSNDGTTPSDRSVDFDFLIKNRFLRTSVSSYMRANNISAESVLQIDFMPKASKPENQGESEALPDWVSGLYFDTGTLFSACYDGTLRAMGGDKLGITSSLAAHSAPIRCIGGNGQGLLATGGHDQQLLVHEVSFGSASREGGRRVGQGVASRNDPYSAWVPTRTTEATLDPDPIFPYLLFSLHSLLCAVPRE